MQRAITEQRQLPLRSCVGIALFNARGRVWVGRRMHKWLDVAQPGAQSPFVWQMPQGGIDRGESAEEAAFRELYEETGVTSAEIVDELDDWLTYELPEALLGIALKGRFRGQRQRWFAMRFTGRTAEINLAPMKGRKAEFDAWKWIDLAEVPGLAVPFKRPLYRRVVRRFSKVVV